MFSLEGTLISASAAPHCGGLARRRNAVGKWEIEKRKAVIRTVLYSGPERLQAEEYITVET